MKTAPNDILVCPSCGSTEVELKSARGSGPAGFISDLLSRMNPAKPALAGTQYLICKKCGHKAVLQIL